MSRGKNDTYLTIFYIFIFCMVLFLFHRFTEQNDARIQRQNRTYAEETAHEMAMRVAENFSGSTDLIRIYALFLSASLKGPEVSPSLLKEIEKSAPFDAVRFTDKYGVNHASDGSTQDVSHRDFYINGVKGESGVGVAFNSSLFHQTTLGFYTPLRYDGEVIGILRGTFLAGKYLKNMLTCSYFGEPAHVFLCLQNGAIIANSSNEILSGNVLDVLSSYRLADKKSIEKARDLLSRGESGSVADSKTGGAANICVQHVPGYDYFLVQIFPPGVSRTMIKNANMAGIELEISLLVLFACVAAVMLWRARIQRRILQKENRDYGIVVGGMSDVFAPRYCSVNLENLQYSYIKTADTRPYPDLPISGPYDALVEYHAKNMADETQKLAFEAFMDPPELKKMLAGTGKAVFEVHVKRDGKEGWENIIAVCYERVNGEPSRVLLLRQDVTELKKREMNAQKKIALMDRKERQYRVAVISNALFSYEFNVSQNRLESVTPREERKLDAIFPLARFNRHHAASEIFDAWRPSVLSDSIDDFNRIASMDHLVACYETGQMEVDLDFWRLNPDGSEICLRQAFYLTKDEDTGDIMAMSVVRDITAQEIKQKEDTRRLKEAWEEAEHANKAKTTFLSNMSHDIRTPMNAIIGFASIAIGHLDNKEQVSDCLQKVLSSSNHLLCLINDILDMSRIESGKLQLKEQECNISELMHNLVNIIQPQVKAKRLELFIDTGEVSHEDVITDPLKLNQVFINLLGNAVKYTPSGGSIFFRITQSKPCPHGYAEFVFTVKDTGIGMSRDFVEHIFEPFTRESTTTRTGIQGTGLGMAITKNIITLMRGNISVESEPGKGSLFTVSLRLKLKDAQKNAETIQELAGQRVLVVDDDFHVCDSVVKMLRKMGLRAEWTTTGREAAYRAKIAKDDGDPFGTYIIDWQMPDLNGVETARKIRKLVNDLAPIIILTAYEWADIEEEAQAAGISGFCAKPLFMSDLKHALLTTHGLLEKKVMAVGDKPSFRGKRILLVDDLEINREVAEFILKESGFEVEMAPDGTDAVEMVARSSPNYYDAILMDVQMPTMNGYEATRIIRSMQREDVKNLPIIAMTANALEDDKAAALKCGMNAHISKPLDINKFFEILGKFLPH